MTAPRYPLLRYRSLGKRSYEVIVQATPRAKGQPIGQVQQFGSLPSMRCWKALGNWPHAGHTPSRQRREDAAADLLATAVTAEYDRVMADWGYTSPPPVTIEDARRVLARHQPART